MSRSQTLIPFHFNRQLDLIPNRVGKWSVLRPGPIASKLEVLGITKPDLVVSGDCMAAIGAHRDRLPVIWFDAHGDFNTFLTTETGSIGGMVLANLCGINGAGGSKLRQASKLYCNPFPSEIVHIGGSEFDPGEKERMLASGVKVVDTLSQVSRNCYLRNHHLHIDTDVVNSRELPSSFHPASNGITREHLMQQLEILLPWTEVLTIKAYDPRLDQAGIGQELVLEIVEKFNNAQRTF